MATRETDITLLAPYDFNAALRFLQKSPSAVLERVEDHGYQRAWHLNGREVLVTVTSAGSARYPCLRVRIDGPEVDEDIVILAIARIRHCLSLDIDATSFYALVDHNPVLARLIGQARYARPVLIADPLESLLWAIIGQQVSTGFARTLRLALVNLAGRSFTWEGRRFPLMPSAHDVLALDENLLGAAHFSRAKIRYLKVAAAAVIGGSLDFLALLAMRTEPGKIIAILMNFPGIGRWTAESVLMRGLGVRTAWPAGDLGLRKALSGAYGHDTLLSEPEVRELAQSWQGWEAWVAFFAWQSLPLRP